MTIRLLLVFGILFGMLCAPSWQVEAGAAMPHCADMAQTQDGTHHDKTPQQSLPCCMGQGCCAPALRLDDAIAIVRKAAQVDTPVYPRLAPQSSADALDPPPRDDPHSLPA